jgi:hypothetical protein
MNCTERKVFVILSDEDCCFPDPIWSHFMRDIHDIDFIIDVVDDTLHLADKGVLESEVSQKG